MKKKILVISIGYPTKENPYFGSFFKEQIEFLSDNYDFDVIIPSETRRGLIFSGATVTTTAEYTAGIRQFYPVFGVSIVRKIFETIGGQIDKRKRAQLTVGIYRSNFYRRYRSKQVKSFISCHKLEYDMVYCISAQEAAFYALLFAMLKNKPLVISEHRPYPHPGWSTIDVEKEAFEKAECFLAISKDKIRQIMLQNIKPKRIAYTGNLVDESVFEYRPVKHEYPTFLIVAACSYFKNYDMFIETMNKLCEKTDKEFRIVIAGYNANKGYARDVDEFERKIFASKFVDKVELIKAVPRNELCDLYNRCDAFVMTSIQEGQPMVALEAAACGLPIFSTRCGGVEDYVTDEIGRLTDITDSDKLSDYLKDFLNGNIKFDGKVIREKILSLYGRAAFRDNITSEFDRVLNG